MAPAQEPGRPHHHVRTGFWSSLQVSGTPSPSFTDDLRPLAGWQKETAMRTTTVLSACATVALLACASENGPTEPEARGTMAPAASPVAAAVDIWRERAHHLGT